LLLLLSLLFIASPRTANAQTKTVKHVNQIWLGYISSTKLTEHYSWWNDFHFVPHGFAVARTGLTRSFGGVNVTAGYAFVLTPVSTTRTELHRKEQRLWAQLYYTAPVGKSVQFIQRLRYEGRFRQNILNNQPVDGYFFVNRVRFLIGLKKTFGPADSNRPRPFIQLSDEILLNFGKRVTYNTFDQNRVMFSVGLQSKNIQYQLGYMNRFVQTGTTQYTLNHTVYIWVTHTLSFRKKSQ
jgi:hypothetical protein